MPTDRKRVSVYLTDEEREWADVISGKEGSGISALLRRLLRECAEKSGLVAHTTKGKKGMAGNSL